MDKEQVNGWTNYATWVTALWFDNDQNLQAIVNELVEVCDNDYRELSDCLKETLEENKPPISGLWGDLLQNQLDGQIYFDEIAQKFLEE